MRTETITIEIFTYDELSDAAKEKAHSDYISNGLVCDWWDTVYDDARYAGIDITAYTERNITGEYRISVEDVVSNILTDHGVDCTTHRTAATYRHQLDTLEKSVIGDCYTPEQDTTYAELENSFLQAILEDYKTLLREEYNYLCSVEQFVEATEANGWEYTADGALH